MTGRAAGHAKYRKAGRRCSETYPLPAAELKAEAPLGEDREEHQSASDHRLNHRELHQRERAYVEQPRRDRTHPSDRPPLGSEQVAGAAKWMAAIDCGCCDRAAVTQQEPDVGQQRTSQRQAVRGTRASAIPSRR